MARNLFIIPLVLLLCLTPPNGKNSIHYIMLSENNPQSSLIIRKCVPVRPLAKLLSSNYIANDLSLVAGWTDSLLTYRDPLNINIIDRRANCPRPPIFKPPPAQSSCSSSTSAAVNVIVLIPLTSPSLKSSSQTRSSPVYTFNSEFTAGHQLEPTPSQCDTKNPFFSLLLIIINKCRRRQSSPILFLCTIIIIINTKWAIAE